jgi:hypothetical protein
MEEKPEFTKANILVRIVMFGALALAGLIGAIYGAFFAAKTDRGFLSASAFIAATSVFLFYRLSSRLRQTQARSSERRSEDFSQNEHFTHHVDDG